MMSQTNMAVNAASFAMDVQVHEIFFTNSHLFQNQPDYGIVSYQILLGMAQLFALLADSQVHSVGSCHRWKETRSPWIVTPYTDITASIEPADRSSRYNLLRRRSDNQDLVTQVCVSYSTKGTDDLMHLPAFRSSSTSLAPKMSVLIVTNEWHRVMIPWSTTRTNHKDWIPSIPRVNASHPPSRARLGWQLGLSSSNPLELKASLSSLHMLVQHGWILCVSLTGNNCDTVLLMSLVP